MSSFEHDSRVVDNADGTFAVPNPGDPQGDYRVEPGRFGGYTVRNDDNHITEEGDRYNRRRRVWATADEAIAFIVGDPIGSPSMNVIGPTDGRLAIGKAGRVYRAGDRVRDTKWGGVCLGTVTGDQDADGFVLVRWDEAAFTEDQVQADELVRAPGHGDPYVPDAVLGGDGL